MGALHSLHEIRPFVSTGRSPGVRGDRKIIVLTDLDGTLLDTGTYSWHRAEDALKALRKRGASVVLVSSKTLGEMELLHRELGLFDPFIVENGGGIVCPADSSVTRVLFAAHSVHPPTKRGGFVLYSLGRPYGELAGLVQEIAAEIGTPMRGFASMPTEEVAALSGLDIDSAALAKKREFDEPFIVDPNAGNADSALERSASRRGLRIVKGDRFLHLIGHGGKGIAVAVVLNAFRQLYARILSIGLGNSRNDFDLLERVDIPVLLGFSPGQQDVPDSLAHAKRVATLGSRGWNQAVLDLLGRA